MTLFNCEQLKKKCTKPMCPALSTAFNFNLIFLLFLTQNWIHFLYKTCQKNIFISYYLLNICISNTCDMCNKQTHVNIFSTYNVHNIVEKFKRKARSSSWCQTILCSFTCIHNTLNCNPNFYFIFFQFYIYLYAMMMMMIIIIWEWISPKGINRTSSEQLMHFMYES